MKQEIRTNIKENDKWNISAMYNDDSKATDDMNDGLKLIDELSLLKGKITSSSSYLLKSLNLYSTAFRKIEKAYVYSHMKKDEDNSNPKYIELFDHAVSALTKSSSESSFLIPEILECDYEIITKFLNEEKELSEYKFMLDELYIQKEHQLNKDEEYILASLSEILNSSDEIFSMLNDVDFNFGTIKNEFGDDEPLTHSTYSKFLESKIREVRKEAYNKLYTKYKELNNTIATIYSYNVKKDVVISNLRKYDSSLEAALTPSQIPLSVYDNLIKSAHNHLNSLQKYILLKKEYLNIEDFKMYDIYVPLITPNEDKYTFEEAVNLSISALTPLGDNYLSILKDGLLNQRWVDKYENKGKTSGAFSFGSYDSFPYILMNFNGKLQDVFTLIHESGHSMHSYYTRKNQPYIYGGHSIFTAEVASTVNETLLIRHLLENSKSKKEKIYFINYYIDAFKSTLFRQTMFAEFEKKAHEKVESGETLTAEYLNSLYNELNILYYGDIVSSDDMIKYEWSRIPHFYNSYYVYQYATGYSAANAIVNKILTEGKSASEQYTEFLKTGSSNYPIELLKIAGVDMSTNSPISSALNTFDELVDSLEKELKG